MNLQEIISKLSIEEKITLLVGENRWRTVAIERLGIPSIYVADGPHGLRKEGVDEDGNKFTHKSVCFPTLSALAASWNRKLVHDVAAALGEEFGAMGVDVLLGPGTNIKRTPLCGRNFEYFSEDPLLAGELSVEYIEGVQSQNVGTSLKHFATNNQEYDRFQISTEVDMRTLREIYLRPFEIAVKKARPWTVMCAYNRLNGVYCSENRLLLNDILREDWGFDGIVMSDWSAVHNGVKALKASLELTMPYNEERIIELKEAYSKGIIKEGEIDAAVERLLSFVFKAAESRKNRANDYNVTEHHSLAKKAALESITLLKNEDGILPVIKDKVKTVSIIGKFAENPVIQGGGSACVQPIRVDSPLDKIRELAGDDINIEYTEAYYDVRPAVNGLNKAMESAGNSDMAVVFVGNPDLIERESYDRDIITLPTFMENIILRVAEINPNTVVVIQAGSAIDMSAWIGSVKAVVFEWYSGQAGGSAIADILFGKSNPSGKIAETFPIRIEDTPAFPTYPGNGYASWYAEGIMVGYRYYDTYKKDVLFPFGYGLSYTTFEYSDLQVSYDNELENKNVTVIFKVKNTGNMDGKEIVQLYIRDVACKVLRPYKELKAFDKIGLKVNEEKTVKFTLDKEAFAYFNTSLNKWHIESGMFQILIGSSSRDIRLTANVDYKSDSDFS